MLFDSSPAMITSPSAFGRHGRADRGGAEVDHHRQADALEDHRQRQRQLEPEQALAVVHAHAPGGIEYLQAAPSPSPLSVFSKIGSRP